MADRGTPFGGALERVGGAVGAGSLLVLVPSVALVADMDAFRRSPTFGYPILAIFGIMMLLGSLALVSALFARLNLSDGREALALPAGSIRAALAMALVVLFALLAVMVYQSLVGGDAVTLRGLSDAARKQLAADPANTDLRVTPVPCPSALGASAASAPAPASAPADACDGGALFKYDVQIGHAVNGPAVDVAKQLLTLIGTLMTSVVSFYFAATTTAAVAAKTMERMQQAAPGGTSAAASADGEDHDHGGVTDPTPDEQLPPAEGGVERASPDLAPPAGA